jgi:hypothetical protein
MVTVAFYLAGPPTAKSTGCAEQIIPVSWIQGELSG